MTGNQFPQDMINLLTLQFKELEWQWLSSLPSCVRQILGGGDENNFDPFDFTHYGEFFLTLSGIKPCMLISDVEYTQYGEEMVQHVFSHLMPYLSYGFDLFRVEYASSTSSSSSSIKNQPRDMYVFANRYHSRYPLVRELFMKPRHGSVPNELLSKALGYPVPTGESTFYYIDETSTQEHGSQCVVFEFTARQGFERCIKMHFEQCAAEFKKLGKVLTISSY